MYSWWISETVTTSRPTDLILTEYIISNIKNIMVYIELRIERVSRWKKQPSDINEQRHFDSKCFFTRWSEAPTVSWKNNIVRDCADSVSRWMSSNRLQVNPSKTKLIWFYSGRRQLSFVENEIELFGSRIAPVHTVRDLGVMLDSNMTMSQHVLRVCQKFYFQIWLIRRLGKALSVESKLLLVHALVHRLL